MELMLTPGREAAVIKEYGSLDFLQMAKLKVLQELPKAEFDAIVDPLIAAKEARVIELGVVGEVMAGGEIVEMPK